MEAEVLGITDAGLLKCKTGCLHEVRRLEEALQCQKEIFRGTFSVGADVLRRHKEAMAALAAAAARAEQPAIIEALDQAGGKSEANLKRVTDWCAVAKFGLQALEKRLEQAVEEVTTLDIKIALVDGTEDVVGTANTRLVDLNALL
jgi:hypothetical protein